MKFKMIVFFLIAFSFAMPAFAQKEFNAMTFNIRLDIASDSMNSWQYRKENLASQILFHEVDILGIQEARENQMQDLQSLLKGYEHVGIARDTGRWGEYSAIFYKTSRFTLVEQNTFWLSEDIYASGKKGWDAAFPRIVTWAKLKDKRTKKVLYVFNTHFDHRGKIARRESAKLLLKQIDLIAGKLPVVVMGDFNASPSDEPIRIIEEKSNPLHLTDSRSLSASPPYGPTGTFNNWTHAEVSQEPIDYVFVKNGVRVLKHGTFSQTWNGRFSSDHFPVFVRVVL
ncbi:MAG: endonuclease/exonuclease/phosphatase family protein [Ginsengibacter sp.]